MVRTGIDLKGNFETEDDYLSFLELINNQLAEITFNGKRKMTCTRMIGSAVVLNIKERDKKEGYWYSLAKMSKITLG